MKLENVDPIGRNCWSQLRERQDQPPHVACTRNGDTLLILILEVVLRGSESIQLTTNRREVGVWFGSESSRQGQHRLLQAHFILTLEKAIRDDKRCEDECEHADD